MITFKQLETEVRRLAKENPDYIYPAASSGEDFSPSCFYMATDDYPACIFGQALSNLGVVLNREYENNDIEVVMHRIGITITASEARWACRVQHYQDRGRIWGVAIASADSEVSLTGEPCPCCTS